MIIYEPHPLNIRRRKSASGSWDHDPKSILRILGIRRGINAQYWDDPTRGMEMEQETHQRGFYVEALAVRQPCRKHQFSKGRNLPK